MRLWRAVPVALALLLCASASANAALGDFGPIYMISDGDTDGSANFVSLAHDPGRNQYLAVWTDQTSPDGDEIVGRIIVPARNEDEAEAGPEFQISSTGPSNSVAWGALRPRVVYNPTADEYMVAWEADDAVDGEFEIWTHRVSGAGAELGSDQQISSQGPAGNTDFDAVQARIAYNPTDNEYLVTWNGDTAGSGDEIFGQRLSAAGAELGGDVPISSMGPDGSTSWSAAGGDVVFNPTAGDYAVVWAGVEVGPSEREIYFQRVTRSGTLAGDDLRVTKIGPEGDGGWGAGPPAIAFDPEGNQYLVAFSAGHTSAGLHEVHIQRLSAAGAEIGTDDHAITAMNGGTPAVAYDPGSNQYMVVFNADHVAQHEEEIFAQRLSSIGTEVGPDDQKISIMGPDGDPNYDALDPTVIAGSSFDEFLVGWHGLDSQFTRREVFVRSADAPPAADETGTKTDTGNQTSGGDKTGTGGGGGGGGGGAGGSPGAPVVSPPTAGPPPATLPARDVQAPLVLVTTPARQKAGGPVRVTVACPATERGGCRVGATGTIAVRNGASARAAATKTFRLRAARKQIAAGAKAVLSLTLVGRKSAKQLKHLVRKKGRKVVATLVVTTEDAAGNVGRRRVTVALTK